MFLSNYKLCLNVSITEMVILTHWGKDKINKHLYHCYKFHKDQPYPMSPVNVHLKSHSVQFSSVQPLSRVRLFATP